MSSGCCIVWLLGTGTVHLQLKHKVLLKDKEQPNIFTIGEIHSFFQCTYIIKLL